MRGSHIFFVHFVLIVFGFPLEVNLWCRDGKPAFERDSANYE